MNRLKLDFSLETAEERNEFLQTYLVQFDNLTEKELETIANYLLWGKGKNGKSLGEGIEIKTRNGTWDKKDKSESLEALLENPGFNDASLQPLNEIPPTKITRQVFSRKEARLNAPAHLQPVFERLWKQIDKLDLLLNYYDLKSGKRINPPREELLKNFTEKEQLLLKEKAEHLNQYQYLKKRHELVELRREQYTLKDSYSAIITTSQHYFQPNENLTLTFDEDIEVYPLGIINGSEVSNLIFEIDFRPRALNEKQLTLISNWLWEKEETQKNGIDFRKLEDVYQIFLNFYELKEQDKEKKDLYGNAGDLLRTLKFYTDLADLTDIQREILQLKIDKVHNADIASMVNRKYGKNYTANYISTIFKQKVILRINEAAQLHLDNVRNCFYFENFKKCSSCGRELLLDPRNFVRNSRAKDGFNSKCKRCEKKDRQRRKKNEVR